MMHLKANHGFFMVWAFALAVTVVSAPRLAHAYGETEDQLFEEDLHEARVRAKDFSVQKLREVKEDLARQSGSVEVKKDRQQFEAEQEKSRRSFVKERNSKPSDWQTEARLEREFDTRKLAEDREMDKYRRSYKQKRARVYKLIQTEAHINENDEYGL